MYIQNRRYSSKFKGFIPLQLLNGLVVLKPAIAYFAYTSRCNPLKQRLGVTVPLSTSLAKYLFEVLAPTFPGNLFGVSLRPPNFLNVRFPAVHQ